MKREDIVVYEIYVRSFNDTTGNGVGDLNGITKKLDYLKELGINYIWLTPINESPQKDNGYDVSDYRKINPDYGTMEDFDNLIKEANSRGIEIMMDMVLNHTSTEHEWFQKALKGDKKYQDYYIFKESENEPTNWESKFGGNSWEYVEELDKWYLHLFHVTQADTNWENEELKQELFDIVNFWINKGVRGFRFDVVNLISKPEVYESNPNTIGKEFYTDGPKIHQYLNELNQNTFGRIQDFATVGEMSSTTIENCIKYSKLDRNELSMAFAFHHLKVDWVDGDQWKMKKPDFNAMKNYYKEWQLEMQKGDGWMANFLSNHDQPRHVGRFGNVDEYHYESATGLSLMYMLLRGTPFIYNGEEFGMKNADYETLDKYDDVWAKIAYNTVIERGGTHEHAMDVLANRSRDNGRYPIHWDDTENAGFTTGKPWLSVSKDYKEINLSNDRGKEKSIFKWYKELIELRKTKEEFKTYDISFNELGENIISYNRGKYTIVYNLVDVEQNYSGIDGNVIMNNYETFEEGILKPHQGVIIER